MRVNQIEEQLSNTLKGIDKLTEDVLIFKEYALENTKVVNGILRKLDDHAERMDKSGERIDKLLVEMAAERKQRQKEIAAERKQRQVEMAEEKKERQREMAEERKQRQMELDNLRKEWQHSMEEDRKLRIAEMNLINKRLERLENKV